MYQRLHLFTFVLVSEHLTEVLNCDVTCVVRIKLNEGRAQQVFMQRDACGEHGREEVGVVDCLVTVRAQCREDFLRLLVRNVELVDHHPLELMQGDGALCVLVHGYEMLTHLGTFFIGKGPSHHLHAAAPELRRVAKLAQSINGALVNNLVMLLALHNPFVLQCRFRGEPLLRIYLQERLDEVGRILRNRAPPLLLERVLAGKDTPRLHSLRARERHVARQEDEGYDTQAPQVALLRVVFLEHLRGDVGERATADMHLDVGVPDLAESKVDQLQVVPILEVIQEVLELQIPVDDAMRVQVVHS
mmetsp:Transcript_40532/g.104903  ORF Transcript_40532/g.104903 Transcript_40532/m.104903 type:complete len:303 (-) Transcript_40532:600-1508(-)